MTATKKRSALKADPTRADYRTPRQARAPQVEEIDLHLGGRVRSARAAREMSRRELAMRLGISPGMLEKYEVGEARMSASRIYYIAAELGVDPGWIYAEFTPGEQTKMTDEVFRSMTINNMRILTELAGLTHDQRQMIMRSIDSFREGNKAIAEREAAGAASQG